MLLLVIKEHVMDVFQKQAAQKHRHGQAGFDGRTTHLGQGLGHLLQITFPANHIQGFAKPGLRVLKLHGSGAANVIGGHVLAMLE